MSNSTQTVSLFSDYKSRYIRAFGTSSEGKKLNDYFITERYVGDTEYVFFELPKIDAKKLIDLVENGRF